MSSPTCLYGFGSLGLCLATELLEVLLNASGGFGVGTLVLSTTLCVLTRCG